MALLPNETKISIELIPNVGLPNIRFGINRTEVRKKMSDLYGASDYMLRNENTECYFNNSLQFSYEKDNTLSFIEAASPPPIFVRIFDINTWEISGDKLLNLLKEMDSINIEISEIGSNPIFKNIHVTLWSLDKQYDHIGNCKTPKWGAIGIGDERYYESICSLYRRFK